MKIKEEGTESSTTMHESDNHAYNHQQSQRSNATTIASSSHHNSMMYNPHDGLQQMATATVTPFYLVQDHPNPSHGIVIDEEQLWQNDMNIASDVASQYTQDSNNSSTDGIEVYRHYAAAGGDDSRSLSSNNNNNNSNNKSNSNSNNATSSSGIAVASQTTQKLKTSIKRASFLVNNVWYKRFVLTSSTLCSAILGLRTTSMVKVSHPELMQFLDDLVFGFLILFTVQVGLELIHYQNKIRKLLTNRGRVLSKHRRDTVVAGHQAAAWVLFDVFILILSWVKAPTFLVLRLFSVLKGLRRAPGVSELRLLIHAIGKALPKMTALATLISVVLYVFAVLFCDFYGDKVAYFDGLNTTVWTLFQILTLDGWSDIAYQTNQVYPHSWVLLVAYILVAVFFCMSLMVGVMSQAVAQAAHERLWTSLQDTNHTTTGKTTTAGNMNVDPHFPQPLYSHPTPSNPPTPPMSSHSATTLTMKSGRGVVVVDNLLGDLGGNDSSTGAAAAMKMTRSDWARLERKVDALTASLQQIARSQATTQELLRRKIE